MEQRKVKKGLVNLSNGKGKSKFTFGVLLQARGRGFRVCVVQFIKAETGEWGEIKAAKKLCIRGIASILTGLTAFALILWLARSRLGCVTGDVFGMVVELVEATALPTFVVRTA